MLMLITLLCRIYSDNQMTNICTFMYSFRLLFSFTAAGDIFDVVLVAVLTIFSAHVNEL